MQDSDATKTTFNGARHCDYVNPSFEPDKANGISPTEEANNIEIENDAVHLEAFEDTAKDITYKIEDVPPWYLCILLGLQHYMTMIGATITIPFILTPLLCIADDDPVRGKFICTIIFVSGIITLLQTTLGVRLPIVQGATFGFLVPTIAILNASPDVCHTEDFYSNDTTKYEELWTSRIREIQGGIIVASIFEVVIGFTGLIGLLLTWITPLAIVPTVSLIGLSLLEAAANKAAGNWGISSMTALLLILCSQYLTDYEAPIPFYSKENGFHWKRFPIFKLFPVLIALAISWITCVILTSTNALGPGSSGRTDTKLTVLRQSPWFYIPHPFQWGIPTVNVASVFGILAGVLSSMIESVGDYYACARLSGAPPPLTHAINRGIGMEGIGCIIAGLFGSGSGTTSYSENIGAIRVTKVASRFVVQAGAVIMILCGMFAKFGALFVTLPEPVVGGLFIVMFSLITAVGLSNLQLVDLNSSRNLFVLGFSIFFGLSFPGWLKANPGSIDSGHPIMDQVGTVLLSTPMFVGGVLGIILDNTIPGTRKERGLDKWNIIPKTSRNANDPEVISCYDLPFGMDAIRRASWCKYVPFSPTFDSYHLKNQINKFISRLRDRVFRLCGRKREVNSP